jgi:hypothetical protein
MLDSMPSPPGLTDATAALGFLFLAHCAEIDVDPLELLQWFAVNYDWEKISDREALDS